MPHIQVTGPTVLQVGGCRVTVTPMEIEPQTQAHLPSAPATPGQSTPKEWQIAEEEVQSKTNMPFERTTPVRIDRLSFAPRVGGTYHAVTGDEVEIAKVIGRDGPLWIIVDTNDRPVVLRRIQLHWHARPRDPAPPEPGDLILHHGTPSSVVEILGEAEVGGWGVTNNLGVAFHVIRGEGRRWIALDVVEAATPN